MLCAAPLSAQKPAAVVFHGFSGVVPSHQHLPHPLMEQNRHPTEDGSDPRHGLGAGQY